MSCDSADQNEVMGVPNRSFSLEFGGTSQLDEATAQRVSELDLAAYGKSEFSVTMQRNLMMRIYNAFRMSETGELSTERLSQLFEYLGRRYRGDEFRTPHVSFDDFWAYWVTVPPDRSFALASAAFSVPFHQQQLSTEESGEKFTHGYRVRFFFTDVETGERREVSPWHDIPLSVRDLVKTTPVSVPNHFNFICEIPKWTRAKFEISTGEAFNPIRQDIKNGVPRFYRHGDMMWNYGAFPQTWESTEITFVEGVQGDNDPLDAVEIGMTQWRTGACTTVKVLGVLGMIDAGQMDWKVICIALSDPVAKFLDDICDVPKFLPGCLDAIREWLRVYKICQGGCENRFAFDGEFKDREFAMNVIRESHLMWQNLTRVKKKSLV